MLVDDLVWGWLAGFAGMLMARCWAGFLRAVGRGVRFRGQPAGRGSAARRLNALVRASVHGQSAVMASRVRRAVRVRRAATCRSR